MVLNEDAEFRNRILDVFEPLLQSFKHTPKAIVLNQKQQLLFRFAVVIQASEADVRSTRDVAHRRRVIALLGKDARRTAKDELKLLIVTGHPPHTHISNIE